MEFMVVIRRIDEIGRIAIPKSIRNKLDVQEGDAFEIRLDDNNNIILKKSEIK